MFFLVYFVPNDFFSHFISSIFIKSIILENKSEDLYNYISSEIDSKIQDFFKNFKEFLNEYGDRGFSREVFYPRWSEAPQYVFDIIKSLVMNQEYEAKRPCHSCNKGKRILWNQQFKTFWYYGSYMPTKGKRTSKKDINSTIQIPDYV